MRDETITKSVIGRGERKLRWRCNLVKIEIVKYCILLQGPETEMRAHMLLFLTSSF